MILYIILLLLLLLLLRSVREEFSSRTVGPALVLLIEEIMAVKPHQRSLIEFGRGRDIVETSGRHLPVPPSILDRLGQCLHLRLASRQLV